MPEPLISIVTPSFNQGEFIEETIQSVLEQDYPNIEYFVIDGGSTDSTLSTLQRYEDRLKWISEPDNGQSDAITKGWRMASGEIWAWLNSDDVYMPGAVRTAVEAIEKNPGAGMVYGNSIKVDRFGNSLGIHQPQEAYRQLPWLKNHIPPNIPQPTAFMRADIVRQVGFIDTNLYYAMDYDLFFRIARVAPIVHIPRVQAKMRIYAGTKSSMNVINNQREKLLVLKRHQKRWFLSAEYWLRYLRYRLWLHFPASVRASIRIIRRAPRDRVYLDGNIL